MGHPFGLTLLLNNLLKNSLLRPFTASSNVKRTNCGVFSVLRPPGIFEPPQKQLGSLQ